MESPLTPKGGIDNIGEVVCEQTTHNKQPTTDNPQPTSTLNFNTIHINLQPTTYNTQPTTHNQKPTHIYLHQLMLFPTFTP